MYALFFFKFSPKNVSFSFVRVSSNVGLRFSGGKLTIYNSVRNDGGGGKRKKGRGMGEYLLSYFN
jgi:hypothetical protein